MKIKVHQLASELKISEKVMLAWLSRSGYPNAVSTHWVSSQLARSARQHFMVLYQKYYPDTQLDDTRIRYKSKTSVDQIEVEDLNILYENERHQNHQLKKQIMNLQSHNINPSELPDTTSIKVHDQKTSVHYEHVLNENIVYKQKIHELNQTQATLDQTCAELSLELEQMRSEVVQLQKQLHAQSQISQSFNQVTQQKKAWQARALELEEQVQSGQNLTLQLKELGLNSFEKQVLLFQTLLQTPESSAQLFSTIKTVDRDAIEKMVKRWVVHTCTHPLCNQSNQLSNRLSLRVDKESKCEVCHGDPETRWFKRMIASCERIHIKRFLMIGADSIHDKIRKLTEGRTIEFRLISELEQSSSARIQSRLESCDLLVLWGPQIVHPDISNAYYQLANVAQCSVLKLNGDTAHISSLARQILYWVSRGTGDALMY